jgi:CarboxypepD_reg-like domain/MORN repeat variant
MNKPLKIKLSIPKPCSEDWNKMTPEGKGRHCNKCSKNIVDFSTYTDKELLDFFAKANGETCGRFSGSQLERAIYEPSNTLIFRKLLFGTALATGIATTAYGQNTVTSQVDNNQSSINAHKRSGKKLPVIDSTYQINGTVVDSANKKPLPFANLVLIHKGIEILSAVTDMNGKFIFILNRRYIGSHFTISLDYFGYSDKRIKLKADKFPIQLSPIYMKFISGVAIIKYKTPLISQGTVVTGIVADSANTHSTPKTNGKIKEYYKSGKLKSKCTYKNGLKNGMEKDYYESGKLKSKILYANGKPGMAKNYDETGKEIIQH